MFISRPLDVLHQILAPYRAASVRGPVGDYAEAYDAVAGLCRRLASGVRRAAAFEGMRRDAPYRSGLRSGWIKVQTQQS